jgi:hypothetical protein
VLIGNNIRRVIHLFRLNANRTGFSCTGGLADLVADSRPSATGAMFGAASAACTDIQVGPTVAST